MTNQVSSIQIKKKPKICAIDLSQEIVEAIQSQNLDCYSGTLGSQIKVPNSGLKNVHYCLLNYDFPRNLHEYDIVVVDLQGREPIEYNESEHINSSKWREKTVFSCRYPATIFDPRPLSSSCLNWELRDFFSKETLIIVFCSAEDTSKYEPTMITPTCSQGIGIIEHSLYEFLSCLEIGYNNKPGESVVASDIGKEIGSFLHKYSKDFIYEIMFQHPTKLAPGELQQIKRNDFVPLLLNSDNEIVGFRDSSLKSSIFAFPQLQNNKKNFLIEFIDEILPALFPKIFPYSEKFSWLNSQNYFLPNQASLLEKKAEIENGYKASLVRVEEEIEENQAKYKFLHNLITETGDNLVKSVEHFLDWLGFENIINMDETNPEIKEEDLQISLEEGILVVEVKGIGGTSKDGECSQINKIKHRRSEQRKSFDVSALYIVNHQRSLPPLERKNPPFNEQQISDAELDKRGLLDTYEIFKLYSRIEDGFITKEDARDSLLNYGLVQFKPSKSLLLGYPLKIHHKGQVIILDIVNLTLHKNATIIVCNDESWFRAKILEIKLNDEKVESISEGKVGVELDHSVLKTSVLWLEDATINVS
jgi:hypothetical protein